MFKNATEFEEGRIMFNDDPSVQQRLILPQLSFADDLLESWRS